MTAHWWCLRPLLCAGAGVVVGAASASAPAQTCADHGIPTGGDPEWHERALMVLTNACRVSPVDYRNAYLPGAPTILQPGNYPAVPPLQWALGLNQSARAHSLELATTSGCGFMHNSCNGTVWYVRISGYYPAWSALGENIAAGYGDPLSTVNALLMDSASTGGPPAADLSSADGHRQNIMSSGFTQLGCGYASGPNQYHLYWTQDFGRPSGASTVCSPVAAGSHIIQGGAVWFLATYYDGANAAPQSARIVINGSSTPMTVHLGTAARGTYRFTSGVGASCRSYHFEFVDASGTLRRYPASGELRTFGEGGCGEDFHAACAADINGSGGADIADVFAFLGLWFAGDARADFNGVGGVTVQDVFDFLHAWFAGCP